MGLLDRVKAGAEQAASQAQRQAQIVQTKRELSNAYHELGKKVHDLVSRGEVSHPELSTAADHINELQARLSESGGSSMDTGGASAPAGDGGDADIVE